MATRNRARVEVIIRDHGWRQALAACTSPASLDIEAGLLDETSQIAEYGFYNEFGTSTIPSRSFIRSTFDANRSIYEQMADDAINDALLRGKRLRGGFTKIAVKMTADIKKKITKLRIPPNAPSTVKAKGSSNPLIDTGALRNAVRWRVRE